METYELDWVRYYPHNHHATLLAIITGCSLEDIILASCKKPRWRGKDYIQAFQNLGFNTNKRFISFDQETQYPCIMRSVSNNEQTERPKGWYSSVYFQNNVYEGNSMIGFNIYLKMNPDLRVTSMLQVWI